MSDFKHKQNTGILLANDKQGNDKRPDWRGDADVDGVLYEVAAWEGSTKNGRPKLSLNIKLKQDRPPAQYADAPKRDIAPSVEEAPFNDDIPF